MVLANPRSVDPQKGARNIVFDVNLPVKDGRGGTLGLLRYFIPENRVNELKKVWENNFTEAFIIAKVLMHTNLFDLFLIFKILFIDRSYA